MKYRFAFERKKLLMLFGGGAAAGILTYVGGIFTGLAMMTPTKSEIAMLKAQHAAQQLTAAAQAAAPPQPPPAAAAPLPAPALPQPQPPVATAVPAAPTGAPAPAPTVVAAAAPAPLPANILGAETSPEKDIFSLQINAYTDAKAARDLQTDLRERGYPATIFTDVDPDTRKEWHAVRIGGFDTLSKASAAAATFTGRERLQALVRPSGKL